MSAITIAIRRLAPDSIRAIDFGGLIALFRVNTEDFLVLLDAFLSGGHERVSSPVLRQKVFYRGVRGPPFGLIFLS